MNSSYNLEPPPTAEVRLHTTAGTIDLELFGKQAPLATKNFLQLCLNGYYDGTIFHRIVPGFIIQGGDPTGTGEGGESSYDGSTFEDEFHSRLRFNRRGLLGMANTGPNDNGSQFFITLDKAEELTGKNTMFGRLVGDSIYVITKLAEAELIEDSDRPLYPSSITKIEIVLNPYPDVVAKKAEKKAAPVAKDTTKKKSKKKGGKTLLSFEDGEGDDAGPLLKKAKFNPKLVRDDETVPIKKPEAQKETKATIRRNYPSPPPKPAHIPPPQAQLPLRNEEMPSRSPSDSPEPEGVKRVSSALERTNAQIAELKASMKRNVQIPAAESNRKKSALEQMVPENVIRGRKRKQANAANAGEAQALAMLDAFKAKLEASTTNSKEDFVDKAPTESKTAETTDQADDDEEAKLCDLHFIANCQSCASWDKDGAEEDDDINDRTWLNHALSFKKDRLGKDLEWKRKNEEELVVIDPREKARDIRDEQRAKKMARTGGSKAWDKDRDRGRQPDRMAGVKG